MPVTTTARVRRRGTKSEHQAFTGLPGEWTHISDANGIAVHGEGAKQKWIGFKGTYSEWNSLDLSKLDTGSVGYCTDIECVVFIAEGPSLRFADPFFADVTALNAFSATLGAKLSTTQIARTLDGDNDIQTYQWGGAAWKKLFDLAAIAESEGLVYVSQSLGSDTTGARERPDLPFATLTAAFTAATAGDTVVVVDGTFHERNVGKHLVDQYWMDGTQLIGTYAADYDAGEATCTLLLSALGGTVISYKVRGEAVFTIDSTGDTVGDSMWFVCRAVDPSSDVSIECKTVSQIRSAPDSEEPLGFGAFTGPGLDKVVVTGTATVWGKLIENVEDAKVESLVYVEKSTPAGASPSSDVFHYNSSVFDLGTIYLRVGKSRWGLGADPAELAGVYNRTSGNLVFEGGSLEGMLFRAKGQVAADARITARIDDYFQDPTKTRIISDGALATAEEYSTVSITITGSAHLKELTSGGNSSTGKVYLNIPQIRRIAVGAPAEGLIRGNFGSQYSHVILSPCQIIDDETLSGGLFKGSSSPSGIVWALGEIRHSCVAGTGDATIESGSFVYDAGLAGF